MRSVVVKLKKRSKIFHQLKLMELSTELDDRLGDLIIELS